MMKQARSDISQGRLVTVVHFQGDVARLLTLAREGDAGLRLVETADVDLRRGNGESLRRALARADRVLILLPASGVIVRQEALTRGGTDDVAELLRLQAEAHLPERIPWHRRGAGLMRTANGGERAILVGWPGDEPHEAVQDLVGHKVRYCPDVVALLALRREHPLAASLLYADREAGSAALVSGESLRCMRVRKSATAADDVERAVRELVALGGGEQSDMAGCLEAAEELRKRERCLAIPDFVRSQWSDVVGPEHTQDLTWWQTYGVALGAAVAALDASPTNTLAHLQAEPMKQKRSPATRLLAAVGKGKRPYAALLICLAILSLLPALRAGSRLLLLRARVGEPAAMRAQQEELTARFALYSAVSERSWPMSKLLADLAAAMPPGIEIDSLTLAHEQQVQMAGVAESLDLLVTFQESLRRSRIFEDVQLPRRNVGEMGRVDFALRAEVVRPWLQAEPAFDYIAQSLQERLYGEAGETTTAIAAVRGEESTERTTASTGSRLTDPRAAQQEETEAPPPLTSDDIRRMTTEEVRNAYTQRLVLRSRPFDEETRKRLNEEADALRTELRQRN